MGKLVFAVRELCAVLLDALRDAVTAADLRHRLRCWRQVVSGAVDVDAPLGAAMQTERGTQ